MRALVMALAVSAVSLSAYVAHADEPAQALPSRRVVEVLVAGGAAEDAGLEETIRELLGRLSLITETQPVGHIDADEPSFRSTARPSVLARVGIDLRARDVAVITIADGRTGEITDRRTVRRDGSPAVVREEVAHVVQSAVDPMLVAERDRVNAPPPPPPPPPVPIATLGDLPAAPPASAPPDADVAPKAAGAPSPLALDLTTSAGGGSYASGAGVVARAGGGAALVWRRGLHPGIGVTAHYVFPFDAGEPIASAHVSIVSLRALPEIELASSRVVALDLVLGGGIDVLRVEPRSNALPSDRLGATVSRVDPLATAAVVGHLSISSGTALSLMLGADIDLASRRWVVDTGGERSAAFAPSRVRPTAMLGFTFGAFGEARFASRGPVR